MSVKIKYKISGLDCGHCAEKISKYFSENENIKKAKIDFPQSLLIVIFKKDELSPVQLQSIASEIGFTIRLVKR